MQPRDHVKRILYHTKLLGLWHRLVNRRTLTIAMFHRVLPDGDCRWAEADPAYTVSETYFGACMSFFLHHYNVVALSELLAARGSRKPLPPRALLITFDDGWADTKESAAPILKKLGLPAAVFIAADAVESGDTIWWQDELSRAARRGNLGSISEKLEFQGDRANGTAQSYGEDNDYLENLCRLHALGETKRRKILSAVSKTNSAAALPRQMLRPGELEKLAQSGIDIGSHAASHRPLTGLSGDCLNQDLERSRAMLARHLGQDHPTAQHCLSIPHGRYDGRVIEAARETGFELLFTSDACINDISEYCGVPDILGRINVSANGLADRTGGLERHRLAAWMFVRPRRILGHPDHAGV